MAFGSHVSNPTELLSISTERVQGHYEHISKNILSTWQGYIYGNGVSFTGSIVDVFWAGLGLSGGKVKAVKPAIKEAVKEVFAATVKDCREYSLEPKDYIHEAKMLLLTGLVRSILKDMIRMDQGFRAKGYLDRVQPLPEDRARARFGVDHGADQLEHFIEQQAEASAFLASQNDRPASGKKGPRKREQKIAAISAHLLKNPYATSTEVFDATGIDASDVRRLWGPIKKAMKDAKRPMPRGSKSSDGTMEAEDESASCEICHDPIAMPFQCEHCGEIVRGECKDCHGPLCGPTIGPIGP